ncbi:GNAT family N-acetyltransferase [Oribacterium sp. oral taxon 108]|uniref:GNAT family N-acetyltransferase n=1 Tax=Oribacterium sp. oral taxon 108 TaxID=712414 RepID=UPI00020DDC9F|nr:GNAT family N-acetyltransferase [Oribacterium sp. oral taxon 108]EGL36562.1 acetyltransferase, GNAT family [Oribacterium sp. oral taxon 108 str. F0425]
MTRKILLLKTPEEQERTKALYREIFPEDTEAFLDFYYKERPKRILAMEEDGQIIAMLHLNPFLLSFFGKEITASYIYAVATKKEKRRQGIMGELLRYAFQLLKEEGEVFCILIPVAESIYSPYGFRTVAKLSKEESEAEEGINVLYAVPTKALLERRKKEALLDSEEDALPENPVLMMKILNKPLFLSYTGYPDESEEELLRRLSGERIHFSDDI